MNLIVISLITLGVIGCLAAIILYVAARIFKVVEDPRIDQVTEVLPGANCGGCGYPGCHGFAEACVKADSLDNLLCPVGGAPTMSKVGTILGMATTTSDPMVAVLRCNGATKHRKKTTNYDGATTCRIVHNLYGGETGCVYGCVGFGDCAVSCKFDALHIDPESQLPVIDEEKCVACGACVKACPKLLIELRKKGPKNRRVYVSCMNKDKGGVARKACSAACIGCGKCVKTCPFEAITLENNLAYIDFNKCRLCRKCVVECPTGAIHELNFPPRVEKPATPDAPQKTPQEKNETVITKKQEDIVVDAPKSEEHIEITTIEAKPQASETAPKIDVTEIQAKEDAHTKEHQPDEKSKTQNPEATMQSLDL